eukprot:4284925-Amphidinium_carterae.1
MNATGSTADSVVHALPEFGFYAVVSVLPPTTPVVGGQTHRHQQPNQQQHHQQLIRITDVAVHMEPKAANHWQCSIFCVLP